MKPEKEKSLMLTAYIAAFLLYSFFLYAALPSKNKLAVSGADNGKMIWQQYNCTACHQVYGLGGYLGPDLTNVYSKKGPEYIRAFLITGTPVMPRFNLSDTAMASIIAYLKEIDASGSADPKTFTINKDGTIEQ
jgi:nitric oxide reductase subunit C